MRDSEVLYCDNSLLTSVACSTEAVLRHVHGLTTSEERAYLKAGTAGHAALAKWFAGMDNVEMHIYPGTDHAFFNDTHGPDCYDEANARLAWNRTISFLRTWEVLQSELAKEYATQPQRPLPLRFGYPDGSPQKKNHLFTVECP